METVVQDCDMDFVRALVQKHTGIAIRDDQDYVVVSRLTPLVRSLNLSSLDELIKKLKHNPPARLLQQVLESMTNHETSFFRDVYQFETLKEDILPELIQRKQSCKKLNIWSAACATGQEPYSIAMVLHDHFFPQLAHWDLKILASDISEQALRIARAGQYNQFEINRGLPAPLLVRHFKKQDATWRVAPFIRKMVEFRNFNLLEAMPGIPRMDIIFLRNTLIYFDEETKRRVLLEVFDNLADGGYLFLGVGESPRHQVAEFECIPKNNTIYFRKPLTRGGA